LLLPVFCFQWGFWLICKQPDGLLCGIIWSDGSYYAALLAAGVRIREYPDGLLHAKSLTLDGEVALIGSANMDRRSFELNYENNILVYDPDLTRVLRTRQQSWIDASEPVTAEAVAAWSRRRRLWNNAIGMLGPVL